MRGKYWACAGRGGSRDRSANTSDFHLRRTREKLGFPFRGAEREAAHDLGWPGAPPRMKQAKPAKPWPWP
jgi:hypothetical protein